MAVTPSPPVVPHLFDSAMDLIAEVEADMARRQRLVEATISNDLQLVMHMIQTDSALLEHRVNRRTTLLSLAAQYGHQEMARFYITSGCPVNVYAGTPVSAIVWAARLQNGVDIIKMLVKAGARLRPTPEETLRWCVSPIHEAARLKRTANCLALVELGADPGVKMGGGLTAYDMAGPTSSVSRVMREGLRRREMRMIMWKLQELAFFVGEVGQRCCMRASTARVLAERRRRGIWMPRLRFLTPSHEREEESGSKKKTTTAQVFAMQLSRDRENAKLIKALFERFDCHLRSEIISYI